MALALRAVGWRETLAAASRARLPWLALAVACHASVVALWAWQTWLLLPAALDALRSPRRLGLAVASGLLMKVMEAGGWTAVERAFGLAPRPGSAVLVLAATNLASAVPASPGNLGVYEGAALLAYTALGVPRDQALALGIVGHIVYLVPFVGAGWVVLSLAQLRARRD